jgi:uncharacterized protein (TIGR03435 family)
MTRATAVIAFTLLTGLAARPDTQAPPSRPSFEVASIKMNKAGGGKGSSTSVGTGDVLRPQGDRLLTRNATLRTIIRYAYGEPNGDQDFVVSLEAARVIGGPSWIRSDAFDIDAKLPPRPTTPRERTLMMRTLLEDRFALKVHLEPRTMPVYALVRARSTGVLGEQLRPRPDKCVQDVDRVTRQPIQCGLRFRAGYVFGTGVFMPGIATGLFQVVDRVVIDRTQLTGRFDFEVRYGEAPGIGQPADRQASPNPDAPSIFVAVQEQLGLKLEATRAPIDVVVVDSVRRPSAN